MTAYKIKLWAQGNIMTILRTICAKLKFINILDMADDQNTFKYHCWVMVLYFKRDIKIRVILNNASLGSAKYMKVLWEAIEGIGFLNWYLKIRLKVGIRNFLTELLLLFLMEGRTKCVLHSIISPKGEI